MEETQKDPNPSHAGSGSQSTSQDVHMEDASGNHSSFSNNATTGSGDNNVSNHSGNKGSSTDEGNPPINDQQRIVEEFQYLLEKSQQMFAGLRELPPTGGRQWQPHFQRTFEVYTKLWKFQQQNRYVLENKDNYGLKRWEVGEIASKIGQLYYHYYLRTSETNYLHESYIFYEAIRDRAYFKDVLDLKNPALMIKKLRYYARFIVVCLLLNKKEVVQQLMNELHGLVNDFVRIFKPVDSMEWQQVLREIANFLEAEKKLIPHTSEGQHLSVPRRLQIERSPRLDKDGLPRLKLAEAILVGNYQNQIKFSELTLDMYHILQSLEREPASSKGTSSENPLVVEKVSSKDENTVEEQSNVVASHDKNNSRRINPHKYLLYKPTFSQLMVYIATAFKEINENSALLLYLSADGIKRPINEENSITGYNGGIVTSSRKTFDKTDIVDTNSLVNCLHPNDLVPFTRKPLFLIVDSPNSTAFSSFPRVFDQPFCCLMSPTEYPTSITDTSQIGSLLTLFLHAPLLAFAFISGIHELAKESWDRCLKLMTEIETDMVELFNKSDLEKSVKRFLQDDFLRQFLVRFVLCQALLKAHTAFQTEKHYPTSSPSLPSELTVTTELFVKIQQLVKEAHVEPLYSFSPESIGIDISSSDMILNK